MSFHNLRPHANTIHVVARLQVPGPSDASMSAVLASYTIGYRHAASRVSLRLEFDEHHI